MDNTRPSTVWVNGIVPKIGDVATSKTVGRSGRALHIWDACPDCGTERWIKRNTKGNLCKSCALRRHATGESNNRWNGGRRHAKNGLFIIIPSDSLFIPMARMVAGGRYEVAEHRLVMAQSLGRCLKPWEIVHHINRNNYDNRIENLLLIPSQTEHHSYTLLQCRVSRLENRVLLLETENIVLRSQLVASCQGNPELNGEAIASPKCVETIYHPSQADEEIVHPSRKLGDEGA